MKLSFNVEIRITVSNLNYAVEVVFDKIYFVL